MEFKKLCIELSLKRKRHVSKSSKASKHIIYHRRIKSKGNKDDPEGHFFKNEKKKKKRNAKRYKNGKSKIFKEGEQIHQYLTQSSICPGIINAGSTCFLPQSI